ncbi:MAG: bifunctional serine/threonine-protein kinase/ABC transporter substrate-binding protein [Anaerolineales bacterium]
MNVGPYRILERVGLGGMASVYKAYDPGTDRYVAIKIVSPQFAQHPEFRERFQREAKSIARLEHAHIIPVHAFGEEGDTAYLVLRYMDTGTLRDRMNDHPMAFDEAGRLTAQIAGALDYAHRNGVIHRDVKPSNILIDSEGNAYLTDFGIAKIVEATVDLTGTGTAMGTPQYMSPEQCRGEKNLTAATDIYSLGVMLYQMLAGQLPFDAETPLAVIHMHLSDPLPPPRQINPQISEGLERVLLKALAKDPEDRYSTAAKFAAALRTALRQAGPAKPVPAKAEKAASVVGSTTIARMRTGVRRFWWAGALLAVLAVFALWAFSQWYGPLTGERFGERAAEIDDTVAATARVVDTGDDVETVAPTARVVDTGEDDQPAAPIFASAQAISVNLGLADAEHGLAQLELGGDGRTKLAAIGNREARVTAPNGTPGRFIYFQVDPSFIFRQETAVLVSVEYFDAGSHVFGLDYDSTDFSSALSGAFKHTENVQLENSNKWRTATFVLEDAYFADRQHRAADFRIHAGGDNDLYINQVTVARSGSVMADAITDPWGHVFLRPGEPISLGIAAAFGNQDVKQLAVDQLDAVRLAVMQFGPIRGFPVEVVEADSRCAPEGGHAAAIELVSLSRLAAVVGTTCSVALNEAMGIFDGARVVFISPSATENHLSQAGLDTFNRTAFPERIFPSMQSFESDPNNPAYQDFAAAFEATYDRPCCEPSAAEAYDAAAILLNAIDAVAVLDEAGGLAIPRKMLATVVRETRAFRGASGEIHFDAAGDRLLP